MKYHSILLACAFCMMNMTVLAQSSAKQLVKAGYAQFESGQHQQCLESCDKALAKDPKCTEALVLRGMLYAVNDRNKSAFNDLTEAIKLGSKDPQAYLFRGELFYRSGNMDAAESDYLQGLKYGPKVPEFHKFLASVHLNQGREDESMRDMERYINLLPDHPDGYALRGLIRMLGADADKGLADIQHALELHSPDSLKLYLAIGMHHLDRGSTDKAIEVFQSATKLFPWSYEPWKGIAAVHQKTGDYERSMEAMDRVIAMDSSVSSGYLNKAKVLVDMQRWDEAIATVNKAIAIGDEDLADAYMVRAATYKDMGKDDAALLDVNQAIAKAPKDASAYQFRGMLRSAAGNHQLALQDHKKALELNPDEPGALHELAMCHFNLGQNDEARSLMKMHLSRDPENGGAWLNLGTIESRIGNYAQAVGHFSKALAFHCTDSAGTYYSRAAAHRELNDLAAASADIDSSLAQKNIGARVLLSVGYELNQLERYKDALDVLERAIATDTTEAYAYNNRGFAKYKLGRYEESIADFDKSIALKNDYYHWPPRNRGNALRALGRYREAIEDFNLSLSYKEDYVEALNDRGETWEALGEREKALSDFQKALQFQPDYAPAKANLARLTK